MSTNPTTENPGALEPAKKQAFEQRVARFEEMLGLALPIVRRLVPKHVDPQTVMAIALSARSRNPALMDCTDASVLRCAILSAQFGLDVSGVGGKAYMIPYWNSGLRVNEAQFQFGYRGLIELAMRTGKIHALTARAVYDGEPFEYEDGLQQTLRHVPQGAPDKDVIAAWAVARHLNNFPQAEVMFRHQIEARRKISKAADGPAWKHWYPEMAQKTVIRALCKKLPDSVDLARALDIEDRADLGLSPLEDVEIQAALAPAIGLLDETPAPAPPVTQTSRVTEKVKKSRSERAAEAAAAGPVVDDPPDEGQQEIPGTRPGEDDRDPGEEG